MKGLPRFKRGSRHSPHPFIHYRVYDIVGKSWTTWQNLKHERFGHGCAKLGNKIIVAGGKNYAERLSSTEIIDVTTGVVKNGGPMISPRQNFQLVTLGGGLFQKILAIGGYNSWTAQTIKCDVDYDEEWNDDSETWKVNPIKLQTPRHMFGAVVVPKSTVC